MFNKGFDHSKSGDATAAIIAYEHVVERFGDSEMPELQVNVAKALVNKGVAHGELGDVQAAIAACDHMVERFGDSDEPELQVNASIALVNKAEAEIQLDRMKEALCTCNEAQRRIELLAGGSEVALARRAAWLKARVLLVLEGRSAALNELRTVYAMFLPGEGSIVSEMLAHIPGLITAGARERDLLDIISSDEEKVEMLLPLVIALRQRTGETVRAPAEVLEAAADIRRLIDS